MELRARLRQLAEALPPSGAVTLTRADLLAMLEEGEGLREDAGVDLTVEQVAEKYGRKPSTIRNWLSARRLPGAYRLRGREWRIPASALEEFAQLEAAGREPARRATRGVDLGEWRNHRREVS